MIKPKMFYWGMQCLAFEERRPKIEHCCIKLDYLALTFIRNL